MSKRQERPDAIAWLLRNHPELNDAQISRLVGTTKSTIETVRDRSHWNMPNIKPVDPVSLGLCKQMELDAEVAKAAKRLERIRKAEAKAAGLSGAVLQDADVTTAEVKPTIDLYQEPEMRSDLTADDVFGNFNKSE